MFGNIGVQYRHVKQFSDLTASESQAVIRLITIGGQVSVLGLAGRLTRAKGFMLACYRERVVGVVAVKTPEASYRSQLEVLLKLPLPALELGWLVVDPEFRQRGIGTALIEKLLPLYAENMYWTVRVENVAAKRVFEKLELGWLVGSYSGNRGVGTCFQRNNF